METTLKATSYFAEKIKSARRTLTKTSELDLLLEEATSNEAWGPDSRTLARIAAASHRFGDFEPIMAFIWKKLEETLSLAARGKLATWRPAQKALVLLEYLLMHGSERAIKDVELRVYVFEDLAGLRCADKQGFDCAQGIRARAAHICCLARSDGTYQAEGARAQELSARLKSLQGFGSSRRDFQTSVEKTERFSLQEKSTERGVLEEGNEEDALIEKSAREQSALHFEARAHGADSAAAIPAASALEPFPVERRFVTEPGETGELRGEVDDFPGGSNKSPRGIRESIGEVDDVSFWEESGAVSKLAEYHPGLDGKPSDHEAAEGERPVRARAFDGSALSSNARVDSWLARRMAVRDPLLASETGGPPEPGDSAETPDSGGFPCEGADCASEGATQTEPQLISEERTLQRATVERLNRAPSGDLITWDDEKPEAPGEESPVGKGTVFPEAARNESPKVPAIPPPRTLE